MKKFIAMALAIALTAALAIGGTTAYLTSQDSDVNVMTLGNVKIQQHEYQRKLNADGTYATDTIDNQTSYVLEGFEQGKALLPIVGDPSTGAAGWDETPVRMSQVDSYGGMQVFAGANAVDKFVTVENTGRSAAYVRTIVAVEVGSSDKDLIGTSYHNVWTRDAIDSVTIDGNTYYVLVYTYNGAELSDGSVRHANGVLPAGDTTYPNLSQVYIKSEATNEDMTALDGNSNGTLDILVLSQAVQTQGFADSKTALDAAFGEVNAANVAAWFGGMGNAKFIEANGSKAQIEGNIEDLENGKNLIVDEKTDILFYDTNAVDAKGATVTLNGTGADAYGYLAFLPDAGENVTVSNLNVTGSGFVEVGHYGQGGGSYTVNNLTIKNLESTLQNEDKGFTLGCAFMAFGDAVLNNCVITGTTAKDGTMAVDLACGQAWSGYADGNDNKISTTVNGGVYGTVYCWSHAIVTIDDAEVDTLYVSPINGTVTIKAGTHIGTLNIDYGTSTANAARIGKIHIEDGAAVDAIVYKGTTYNTLADVIAALS